MTEFDLICTFEGLSTSSTQSLLERLTPYVNVMDKTFGIATDFKVNVVVQDVRFKMFAEKPNPLQKLLIPGKWVLLLLDRIENERATTASEAGEAAWWLAGYLALVGVCECRCRWMEYIGKGYRPGNAYDPGFVAKLKCAIERVTLMSVAYPVNGPSPGPLIRIYNRVRPSLMTMLVVRPKGPIQYMDMERLIQSLDALEPLNRITIRTTNIPEQFVDDAAPTDAFSKSRTYTRRESEAFLDAKFGRSASFPITALVEAMLWAILHSFAYETPPPGRGASTHAVTTLNHTWLPMNLDGSDLYDAKQHYDSARQRFNSVKAAIDPNRSILQTIQPLFAPELQHFMGLAFNAHQSDLNVKIDYAKLGNQSDAWKSGDPAIGMSIFKPPTSDTELRKASVSGSEEGAKVLDVAVGQ